MNVNNIKSLELERFSENSAGLILQRNQLDSFFKSLNYETERLENGIKGYCPACKSSYCFIGINGKRHKIYWKCYDRACSSNDGRSVFCRNFLGLVRGLSADGKLSTAIAVIAKFLGCEGRSFDITNGKCEGRPDRSPNESQSVKEDPDISDLLEQVKLSAADEVPGDDIPF